MQFAQLSGLQQPTPEPKGQRPLKLPLLGKYHIHMASRQDSAGQFLQTIVLQVETAEATEIPKKTLGKCSQFVASQVKSVQIFQAIKHSSRKLSQIHVFQKQIASATWIQIWCCIANV